MKRMNMNQVRSWCRMLLAGWLLAGFAPSAWSGLLFTGPFAPGNWTQTPFGGNNGVFGFTGTGISTVMVLQSSMTAGTSYTILSAVNSGATESVSFNWTLTANGNVGAPLAYYSVGGPDIPLVGNSGSLSISIPTGEALSFELVGNVSPGKAPAQLGISEVPEAGNALAGLLVVAVAGFECFRRKRTAVG